jgi:hypothetical protein
MLPSEKNQNDTLKLLSENIHAVPIHELSHEIRLPTMHYSSSLNKICPNLPKHVKLTWLVVSNVFYFP